MTKFLRFFAAFRRLEAELVAARQETADWRLRWQEERTQVASLVAQSEHIHEQFADAMFLRFIGRSVFAKLPMAAPQGIDEAPKKTKETHAPQFVAAQKTKEFMEAANKRLERMRGTIKQEAS